MDDSELDFVDICPKLLKGNRKKAVRQRELKTQTEQPIDPRNKRKDDTAESQKASADGGPGTGAAAPASDTALSTENITRAKDKVRLKMQQFRRDNPQRMVFGKRSEQTALKKNDLPQVEDRRECHEAERAEPVDSDEALAIHLQKELDSETRLVALEDEGLFFCQLCNKDLSHMTPERRTQHINRCLDDKEGHTAPPLPPARGLECPICGKLFKSQKSRSSHLKRCSSDMGVPPALLLQALQRQAEETQSNAIRNAPSGGQKRKGSKSNMPISKKPRKKVENLDEDTMMAMALSSSLMEQEREKGREAQAERGIIIETTAPIVPKGPALKWKPNAEKGRGKKRNGGVHRSPPLLLVQDTGTAQARIQERVSALLLNSRVPSPPTPSLSPSRLPAQRGTAPLWQKSALDSVFCTADFYSPELEEFIVPWEAASKVVPRLESGDNPDLTTQLRKSGSPVSTSRPATETAASQTEHPSVVSTPGTDKFLGCSQALQDLMDLAEDGMTLTQYHYPTSEPRKEQQSGTGHALNLPLSGFVPKEEHLNLGVSGFLPEAQGGIHGSLLRTAPNGQKLNCLLLPKLAMDLGSMVNNPQLSDVQLQVDSGEVYFAHSLMLYTRCPLLAEMIHESGFGAQEDGAPAAKRVLLNDVPGQAVFALLQFLYTASCSVTPSVMPHVRELASRFDLKDLQGFCQLQEEATLQIDGRDQHPDSQTDAALTELLRSMWNDEDSEDGATEDHPFDHGDEIHGRPEEPRLGEGDMREERVDEDELVEIYEFAATQRKREESDSVEEGTFEKGLPEVSPRPMETDDRKGDGEHNANASLDRSYNRLFSQSWGESDEKDFSASPGAKLRSHLSTRLPASEVSARLVLQSSVSEIHKLSPSPPPNPRNLPVPGQSPVSVDNISKTSERGGLKRADPAAVCKVSSSSERNEPELVVLSDSSDDVNIDLTQSSNSPSPNHAKTFTGIKEKHASDFHRRSTQEVDTHPADDEASSGDCSAEVSWLIPSTPVPPGKSVRSSSSQTKSSFCRTRLFSKPGGSADSLPHSLGCSTGKDSLHKSSSRKPSISSGKIRDRQRSLDSISDKCFDSSGFVVPQSPPKYFHLEGHCGSRLNSSKQETPLPIPAYSSTPVHTDVSKLLSDPLFGAEKVVPTQDTTERISESPEEAVQSFHLSPLSERSPSQIKTNSRSLNNNSLSERCDRGANEGAALGNVGGDDFGAKDGESSLMQSFMGEPPIAFNDSWGLDACFENPHFSLKLDDSKGSPQREDSRGVRAATPAAPPSTGPDRGPTAATKKFTSSDEVSASDICRPDETEPAHNNSLSDSKIWDSWGEEEEEEERDAALPLSQRLKPAVHHKTPISNFKKRQDLVPITPMPHFSDMDTPDLKNKLNKFGVRPLPKRQMILKLKEIHQYTHQLASSDSEGEAPPAGQTCQAKASIPSSACSRAAPCAQATFKQPTASPSKSSREDEPLSASQGSNTSSTAESERSNPELVQLSDEDSDSEGGVSASQTASRLQERLQAVRAFILSDSSLYGQILQYKPLVLSQFQQQLKASGIRLGVTKLADYLDSQCITFTTAKPGQSVPSRHRRVKKTGTAGVSGVGRKRATSASH